MPEVPFAQIEVRRMVSSSFRLQATVLLHRVDCPPPISQRHKAFSTTFSPSKHASTGWTSKKTSCVCSTLLYFLNITPKVILIVSQSLPMFHWNGNNTKTYTAHEAYRNTSSFTRGTGKRKAYKLSSENLKGRYLGVDGNEYIYRLWPETVYDYVCVCYIFLIP